MQYEAWYHGWNTDLKSWRSCYDWKPFGLRWVSAIMVWAYHSYMCYRNIKCLTHANKITCVSKYAMQNLFDNARKYGFEIVPIKKERG